MTPRLSAFLSELRRRRVFRVAVVYAGVAFIVLQIIDVAFEYLRIPDWIGSLIIVLLGIGFVIAVGLAWAFDITEKGVVRTAAKEEAAETKALLRPLIGNKTLAIVAAVAVAAAVWSWWGRPASVGPITSIAVLPLENLMNDPDQDYFVDGMHDALITELSRISALTVISRNSAMYYKDKDIRTPEIARQLNVDALVEGTVLRVGEQVRITAQLIDGRTDKHLWAERYDRDLVDILELHSEVARAIAKEIKVTLTPEEEARLASARPVDPKAHEAYLLGRHYYSKGLEPDLKQAIKYFERAIEIDSTFALGYAGLADAYGSLGGANILSPEDTWLNARAAAEKALGIDEGLADAHTSLANVKYWYDWDWTGAEREFKRAIEINPSSGDARVWYARFLISVGRHDEAIAQIERARELDPQSMIMWGDIEGMMLSFAGEYAEAIQKAGNFIESNPDNPWGHWTLAYASAGQGRYEEAIAPLKTAMELLGDDVNDEIGILGYLYGKLGKKDEALRQLDKLGELIAKGRYVSPMSRCWIYIGLGDKDQAFAWLEKGYERRAGWPMMDLKTSFVFDPLRDDPRFADLLRRMNFPE